MKKLRLALTKKCRESKNFAETLMWGCIAIMIIIAII